MTNKKTKYIYKHSIYGGGPNGANRSDSYQFFVESGIKLHGDSKNDYFYSWEFAGDSCSWFEFSHTEEVEIKPTVTKLPSDNKYANGMNWKNVNIKGANSRLRKPKAKKETKKAEPKKKTKGQELYYYPPVQPDESN